MAHAPVLIEKPKPLEFADSKIPASKSHRLRAEGQGGHRKEKVVACASWKPLQRVP